MALLNLSILPQPKEQPSAAALGGHAHGGALAKGNDGFRSILTAAIETGGRQPSAVGDVPQGGVLSIGPPTASQNGLTPLSDGGDLLVGGWAAATAGPKEVGYSSAVGSDHVWRIGHEGLQAGVPVVPAAWKNGASSDGGAGQAGAVSGGGVASGLTDSVSWSGVVQVDSGMAPGEMLVAGPDASGNASVTPMSGIAAGGEEVSGQAHMAPTPGRVAGEEDVDTRAGGDSAEVAPDVAAGVGAVWSDRGRDETDLVVLQGSGGDSGTIPGVEKRELSGQAAVAGLTRHPVQIAPGYAMAGPLAGDEIDSAISQQSAGQSGAVSGGEEAGLTDCLAGRVGGDRSQGGSVRRPAGAGLRVGGSLSASLLEAPAPAVRAGLGAHQGEGVAEDPAVGAESLPHDLVRASDPSGDSQDAYKESSPPGAAPAGSGGPSDGASGVLAELQASSYYAGSITGRQDGRRSVGGDGANTGRGSAVDPGPIPKIKRDESNGRTRGQRELASVNAGLTTRGHGVESAPGSEATIERDAGSGMGGKDESRSVVGGRTTAGQGAAVFPGPDHPIDGAAGGVGTGGESADSGQPGKRGVSDLANDRQMSAGRAAVIGTMGIASKPTASAPAASSNPPKLESSSPLQSHALDVAPARLVRQAIGTRDGEISGEANQPANGAVTTGLWSGILGGNGVTAAADSPVTRGAATTGADESAKARTPDEGPIPSTIGVEIGQPDGNQGARQEGISAKAAVIPKGGPSEQGTASQWQEAPSLAEEPRSDRTIHEVLAQASEASHPATAKAAQLDAGYPTSAGRVLDGGQQAVRGQAGEQAEVLSAAFGQRNARAQDGPGQMPGASTIVTARVASPPSSASDTSTAASGLAMHGLRDAEITVHSEQTLYSDRPGIGPLLSGMTAGGRMSAGDASVRMAVGDETGVYASRDNTKTQVPPRSAAVPSSLSGTRQGISELRLLGLLPSPAQGFDLTAAGGRIVMEGTLPPATVPGAAPAEGKFAGTGVTMQAPVPSPDVQFRMAGSHALPVAVAEVVPGDAGLKAALSRAGAAATGVGETVKQGKEGRSPIMFALPGQSGPVAQVGGLNDRPAGSLDRSSPAPSVAPEMPVAGDAGTEGGSLDYPSGDAPRSLTSAPPTASDSADYQPSPKTVPVGSAFPKSASGMQPGQMAGSASLRGDNVLSADASLRNAAARPASAADSRVWNGRYEAPDDAAMPDRPVAPTVAAGTMAGTDGVVAEDKSANPMDRSGAAEQQVHRQAGRGESGIALEVHRSAGGVMTADSIRAGQGGQSGKASGASDQMIAVRIEEKSERASADTTRIERGRTFGVDSGPTTLEEQKGWKSPAAALVAQGPPERKRFVDAAPDASGQPRQKSLGGPQTIQTAGQPSSERQGRPDTQTQSHTGRQTEQVFGTGVTSTSDSGIAGRHDAATPAPVVGDEAAGAPHSAAMLQQGARASAGDASSSRGVVPGLARTPEFTEPKDLIPQIVRSAVLSSQRGDATITLRLDPPELGALRMRLTSGAGGVSASITVERPDLKQSIESNLHQLRTALNDCGVQIHTFTVTVGDDSRQGQSRPDDSYRPHLPNNPPHPDRNARDERQEGRRPSPRHLDYRTVDYFA